MTVELPGWEDAWVTPLSFEGDGEAERLSVEQGKLALRLTADVPVRISRTRDR